MLLQLGRDLSVREGLMQSRLLRSAPPARTSGTGGSPPGRQQHRHEDRHWLTIGGGRARGETLAEAGARELREEVGIDVAPAALGEPLGTTVVRYAAFALLPVTQYQTYFAIAVDAAEVTAEHQGLLERLTIERHEWLTVEDLERRPERLVDLEMPRLMRAAIAVVRGQGSS